ncbi:Nicotinamidase-related amidase [Oribacterium sp. KHPX15]|uniref:cysteine hydrolase family protein n=1 Tax=unclassified Oribacterium TaxID=2629782 RepID=UPI0004E18271|nr:MULTISPECIES: isochorismatase family cysteine hydrolase [unclassified Oribacterium]SEA60242.1 Nicotinamidase-related amidase [Oribacterium sp. KHPX15]
MKNKALVVIDLQNDITKNYKKIIGQVNKAIDWAVTGDMHVIYIRHYNLSEKTRTFKPDTKGSELVPELKVVSENIFEKSKASALTSEAFAGFIEENGIEEFYITGADATGCVKSTSYNLAKAGYKVCVISDCVTSYDLKKMDEMFKYYADKGCEVQPLEKCIGDSKEL